MFFFRVFTSLFVGIGIVCGISFLSAQVSLVIDGESTNAILKKKNYVLLTMTKPFYRTNLSDAIIRIDVSKDEPRGQFRAGIITLAGTGQEDDGEFIKVLSHELGHYMDIFRLISDSQKRDPSAIFYSISWKTANERLREAKVNDFVSGYALTNQYEDFAETFTFYIFHNRTFLEKSKKNSILAEKYKFMKERVFIKGEFQGTEYAIDPKGIGSYLWDTTKIRISLKKYLFSLG